MRIRLEMVLWLGLELGNEVVDEDSVGDGGFCMPHLTRSRFLILLHVT